MKLEMNSKTIFTLAGAAVMVSSVITIADYVVRRSKAKSSHAGELIAGIAGIAIGVALAAEPKRRERSSKLVVDDMFNDEDAALAHEQIRETLNQETDRGSLPTDHLRTIEVDSETSIEDFIS